MVETPSIPPSSSGNSPRITSAAAGTAGVGQNAGTQAAVTISSGSVLSGIVTAADGKGNITLETAAVKLVLQSAIALPRNAQVTVRVEQPVTSDSMPTVRILTVDGKPVSQYLQQAQQAANQQNQTSQAGTLPPSAQNPQNPTEVARPTAQVIEMSARPAVADAAKPGNAPDAQLQATVNARAAAASQLTISATQTLPAVLLRPMLTAKTAEVLNNLSQPLLDISGKPIPQSEPAPLTPAMLRPGMQMQVRILDMPQLPQSAVQPPNTAVGQPNAPVNAVGAASSAVTGTTAPLPTAQVSPSASQPANMIPQPAPAQQAVQPPLPAQTTASTPQTIPLPAGDSIAQKAAYAIYAKQPAAPLNMGEATPKSSAPVPQIPPSSVPQQSAPPPGNASFAPAALTPNAAPTQMQTVQPQNIAANNPANYVTLSPKVVENLLTSAEGKGLPAGQMAAVVVGKEQAGALTVHTRLGLFSIPAPQAGVNVQPGTVITWQVRQILPMLQQAIPPDATTALTNAVHVGRDGSAFHELVGLIQTMQGANAAQTLQRLVPQTGAALSAGILLFMSVVKKGDIASWLGKELHDAIESSGRGDVLQRLSGELTALRSLFGGGEQQQTNNWQAMFFPVMVGKELETAQLFVKPDDKGNKEGGGGGQRFVVELDLSAFGPMQMDGLFKRQEGGSQFNLVIRTIEALPDAVKTDIYAIFDSSQKATGLNGGVTFRTVPEFPVNPLEEMQAEQRGDGSILA